MVSASPLGYTRDPVIGVITFALAATLVAAFYIHAIVGRPSSITTPITLAVVLLLLMLLALCGVVTKVYWRVSTPLRAASVILLYVAIFLGVCSTAKTLLDRSFSLQDWGVAFVQLGIPVLISFVPSRVALIRVVVVLAVAFALADLAANAATASGIGHFAKEIGSGTSYGPHWLGIPENTFAEGVTAFIAVAGLSWEIDRRRGVAVILLLLVLGALVFSLWMIRARTDFATSLLTIPLLVFRRFLRMPTALLAIAIGVGLLGAVFYTNPYGTDEMLRAMLITDGFASALHYPLLGAGPHYLNSTELAVASYIKLSRAGVTESGALDWAIAYGVVSTLCLFGSAFCALFASRVRATLPAVLLAGLIGNFVIVGNLLAPVTAVLFFSSLLVCQREETFILAVRSNAI